MLHVQPKSGDDSFGDFWRKERKTHSNDLGLTSDSHIEGALYERPRYISCAKPLTQKVSFRANCICRAVVTVSVI